MRILAPCLAAALLAAACGDDGSSSAADAGVADAGAVDAAAEPDAFAGLCDDGDLLASLQAVPGVVEVQEDECGPYVEGPARCFVAALSQPLDHAQPAGPTFPNYFKLVHRSCDAPTVVDTTGYAMAEVFYTGELSVLFGANWIELEHRYQGRSQPAEDVWRFSALTIANGAADVHRTIETLRAFYAGRWVTTGVSKGGATALYHRAAYPEDVDGTVPYVAPISLERVDPRYQDYMDTIGPPACRQAMRDLQIAALTDRRAALAGLLAAEFSVPEAEADFYLEGAIKALDWGFWQYWGGVYCADLPDASSTDEEVYELIASMFFRPSPADEVVPPADQRAALALTYEWQTEQGFADQLGAHLIPHLQHPHVSSAQSFEEQTGLVLPAFDPSTSERAIAWAQSDARDLVFIYGQWDPWTGGQVVPGDGPRVASFMVPEATHGAGLWGLPAAEKEAALALIAEAMGRPAQPMRGRSARAAERLRHEVVRHHLREIVVRGAGARMWR